ncbi:type I restriction endonuclease subunit S [Lactobacillus sp. UMNPBX7]|nr:type I restriction endonuclease subunit S [Lactobacillus sp. UMNPBX13]PEH00876.1 type I restriction endonuclease subunit S [Lactobacillus sp. UMNPBX7]
MNNAKKSLVPHRRFKEFQNAGAWEQRKLGDMGNVITGNTPSTKDKSNWTTDKNKGHIWITPTDINRKVLFDSERYLSDKGWLKARKIPKNSVLITSIASIGKNAINGIDAAFNQQINALILQNNNYYFVLSLMDKEKKRFEALAGQTATPIINKSTFSSFQLQIPSENEQNKIGNFFKKIDNLITLHQRKLDKLKRVKSAYLTEMFPAEGEREPKRRFPGFTGAWEQRKLGDVVERFDNLRIPVTSSKRKRGITPYYGANGIQDYVQGYTHDGEFVLVAEDGANDLQNYPIHYVNGKVWVNNHAHVLQGKKDIADNLFLVNAIKRIKFETYLVGGSRAKLNADVMMKLPIKMPKLNEQQKLGKYFSRIDTLIALHQRKLDKLQKLKNAYLNEMFV